MTPEPARVYNPSWASPGPVNPPNSVPGFVYVVPSAISPAELFVCLLLSARLLTGKLDWNLWE